MNRTLIALLSLPLLGAAAGPDKPDAAVPPMQEQAAGYAFVRGDTLYSLARWAGTNVAALLAANPGIDPTKIEIGDVVTLPAAARDPAPARFREFGDGPGPAAARMAVRTAAPQPPPRIRPAPPPPPVRPAPPPRARPAPPPEPAPANEDEDKPRNGPEGM